MNANRPLVSLNNQKNERFKRQPKQNGKVVDYNGTSDYDSITTSW